MADAFSAMGMDNAIGMGGDSLAEMFSAMGADNIGSVGAEGMQEAALSMSGDALGQMDPEAAAAMMDTMGSAEATDALGGEQLAGIIGAINPDELAEVMPSEVLMEAAEKMTIENFEAMSGEGAGAMFDVLGSEQVFESLGEVQVAGLFSAMDAEQMATLGTETISCLLYTSDAADE